MTSVGVGTQEEILAREKIRWGMFSFEKNMMLCSVQFDYIDML